MIVFKNYFKIVKNNLGMILMFLGITITIALLNTTYGNFSDKEYKETKPKIAIINRDTNNKLTNNFISYLKDNSQILKIKDDKKTIQDYLYLHKVDLIVIIPEDFSKNLLDGTEPNIIIKQSMESSKEYFLLLINRYIKISKLYTNSGMNEELLIESINKDLENEVNIEFLSNKTKGMNKLAIFYSFQNYSMIGILLFVIGTIMCSYNNDTISKRNKVSSIKRSNFSFQLLLGHLTLAVSLCLVFVILVLFLFKEYAFTLNNLFMIINLICFALSISSMGYLIGSFVKDTNIMSGIQNVVALGLSFISGCFVPVRFLDPNIVNFSKLFPSYYFIKNNYNLASINTFNIDKLLPIFKSMFVILFIGLIYYLISLIISKKKVN